MENVETPLNGTGPLVAETLAATGLWDGLSGVKLSWV